MVFEREKFNSLLNLLNRLCPLSLETRLILLTLSSRESEELFDRDREESLLWIFPHIVGRCALSGLNANYGTQIGQRK